MPRPEDSILDQLTKQNQEWVDEVNAEDPCFFANTAEKQEPKVVLRRFLKENRL